MLPETWRQSARYGNEDRGKFGPPSKSPATWSDEANVRGASAGPLHQHFAPKEPHERSRRTQETRGEGKFFRSSDRHPAQDYKRPPSIDGHRRLARTGDEKTRHRRNEVDERMGALQVAGFTKAPTQPRHERHGEVPVIRPEAAVIYFESNVSDWASRNGNIQRIVSYGVPEVQARLLLKRFVRDVEAGTLSSDAHFYGIDRFGQPHQEDSIEIIYSTIFFSWAARLDELYGVMPAVLAHIQRLVESASLPFPSDGYAKARQLRRKVIMHVGPTNSGKTHHALRALAAARAGVYAGPLRLLAHEIFQRLNSGSIVPLGIEQDPAAPAGPNPAYVRPCNMITGEEKRIMGDDVTLLSCTVEMLNLNTYYDVAVIDEIQMLGDAERGQAWTSAVLGLTAKELHLCGEETVVPVVEALLAHTGDEIEVRRYNRLTTLTVDDNVLDGDLSKIQKGDCIVAFSRSSIFALKKEVEKATGMRCAVVYGRLPPETRAEQAALFNDSNSGYDVIIGSDAIGMGLNLYVFVSALNIGQVSLTSTIGRSRGSSSLLPQNSTAKIWCLFRFHL